MFAPFFVLLVLGFIAWLFKQPAVKGKCGELFVAFCLNTRLDKNTYQVINDVMIPDDNGGTTQIDHIVLSPFGIFVIETKNMKGWIFGDRHSEKWTQQIYKNKKTFHNPFRQNYKHIQSLVSITEIPENNFFHIIVFVGECTIKTRDKLPDALVENGTQLVNYIRSFTKITLDDASLKQISDIISNHRLSNTYSNKKQHKQYVKQIIQAKNTPEPDKDSSKPQTGVPQCVHAPISCPQCGSPMVQRKAQRGANAGKIFWGCSRYPACRAVINEYQTDTNEE